VKQTGTTQGNGSPGYKT